MRKYNNFSSVCNSCGGKGYFTKPEKCSRVIFSGCPKCGSHEEISKQKNCKGTNVLIDYSDIAKKFIDYYDNQERIKVKFSDGEIKTGTVAMTTGWKPAFLLMLKSNSLGSSHILTDKEKIIYAD